MLKNQISSLSGVGKVHMIGIGGSGVFPIAKILLDKGLSVEGSDAAESETLDKVRKLGIKVNVGHESGNLGDADLVIYSAAVKKDNPEILEAERRGIPCVERSAALGLLTSDYENSVAVSGTHGKTSTSGMITNVLIDAGKDPNAVIGGTLPRIGGNGRTGNSDIIVCEACEYLDGFLKLSPSIAVILNVDADHLDYFKDINGVKKSFGEFAKRVSKLLVVNGDDENSVEAASGASARKIFYGISDKNDYQAKNVESKAGRFISFDIFERGVKVTRVSLKVPGKHNVYNALAAAAVCSSLGVGWDVISSSLGNFTGVHRRFEFLGTIGGITVADDFAHHPTEIKATLKTASEMGFNRVWAVFQPHTFSRTHMLLDEFAKALSIADKTVLSDILPVRESNVYNVRSEDLAKKIDGCRCLGTFDRIADFISENAADGDLVITMGGGDVYKCAHMIIKRLENKI